MAKIITVTANTAIDFVVKLNGLAANDNMQAISSADFTCGKGVNVARALASLGCPAICSGFVGRQTLGRFQAIQSEWLQVDLTDVAGKSRTNFTLFDQADNKETHIRTAGYSVTAGDCARLIETLRANIQTDDIVVFSGSLPAGAPIDWYRTLIEVCRKKAALPFLDSSGQHLLEGLRAKPYLLKPNLQELETIAGCALTSEQAVVDAADYLLRQGIAAVVVSLGQHGVLALVDHSVFKAEFGGVLNQIISTIGCGDALVAGLAFAKLQGLGWEAAFKWAVGCATANALTMEPGSFAHDTALKFAEQVIVTKL